MHITALLSPAKEVSKTFISQNNHETYYAYVQVS